MAGIIVYNIDTKTLLMGVERSKYDIIGYTNYDKKTGQKKGRKISEFIARFPQYPKIEDRLKEKFPDIDLDSFLIDESDKRLGTGNICNFINIMLPDEVTNIGIPDSTHLVNQGIGCALSRKGRYKGYPKGQVDSKDGGNPVETALREFYEEVIFDLKTILVKDPSGNIKVERLPTPTIRDDLDLNTLYDIKSHGGYNFYYVQVNDTTAKDILVAYEKEKYHSELFDVNFYDPMAINLSYLNDPSKQVTNYYANVLFPLPKPETYESPSKRQKRGGDINYHLLSDKYKNKLLFTQLFHYY
jgi:8-oxo-dGTP pyrophosphatase MutT (NUDIX family)